MVAMTPRRDREVASEFGPVDDLSVGWLNRLGLILFLLVLVLSPLLYDLVSRSAGF